MRPFCKLTILLTAVCLCALATMAASSARAQIPHFKIENPASGYATGKMGNSVAIDGNTMVMGAPDSTFFSSLPTSFFFTGMVQIYVKDDTGKWVLQADLQVPEAKHDNAFGWCVAISGDTVVVGAPEDDGTNADYSSVYVFTRTGMTWTQQARLTASDITAYDSFGKSVSVSGDRLLVGAPGKDNGGVNFGSAYIFMRSGTAWTQQQKLTAPDGAANDSFGSTVAVSGDTAIIGALSNDEKGVDSGAAYVFTRGNSVWSQQAKLTASDAVAGLSFGNSVAISGDSAIIGAASDDAAGADSGSAYVFARNGSIWSQQTKLTASDAAAGDYFGSAVSLAGDTAVIGANGDVDTTSSSGSAYVFTRNGSTWSQQAKLTASDAMANDAFGFSVSVSGDTVGVGAPGVNVPGMKHRDSAYVFTRSNDGWTQQARLATDNPAGGSRFGGPVSISGDTAIIGAIGAMYFHPSAYIFTRSGDTWTQQAKLTPINTRLYETYINNHISVSISGDTAAIGVETAYHIGRFYVYTRIGSEWTQQAQLVVPDIPADSGFGTNVLISGDTILAGASTDNSPVHECGSVYVFTRKGSIWTKEAKLTASDATTGAEFGWPVGFSGDTAIVGAYAMNKCTGAAYVFTRSGGNWVQQAKLTASDPIEYSCFGLGVSIAGDMAVIGAYSGFYVFTRSGSTWTQQAKFMAPDAAGSFGYPLQLSGDKLIIGASGENDNTGALYVFRLSGGSWKQQAKLMSSNAKAGDCFGWCSSIDAGRVIIGSPSEDDPEIDSGAAYVFDLNTLLHPTQANPAWDLYK